MKSLNPVFRPWMAGFALAGSALLSGQALAATTAPSITTPLTAPLSVIGGYETDLTNVRGTFDPTWLGGAASFSSAFDLTGMTMGGSLLLTQAVSKVTFTLVGFESNFNNAFTVGGQTLTNFNNFNSSSSTNSANLGASFSFDNVAAGLLNFGFLKDGLGAVKGNGHISTGVMLANDNRSALILFNDRLGDRDYDDMIVKMSITPLLSVTPVPEPETITMLLGGLGLMGLMARRRQRRG